MHATRFPSLEKLDTAILYVFELISSLAVLLLAFGLIASMANVLTEGSVLSDNVAMQHIWAWTQCVAIDASVAGTILRTFQYYARKEWVKTVLSAFLSLLLLFTAAIVSNIEALQQTLNVALGVAYAHVFVPVEALIWIRSLCIVLLIVAHALRHVHPGQPSPAIAPITSRQNQQNSISPKETEQSAFTPTIVAEEPVQALPSPQNEQANHQAIAESAGEEKERTPTNLPMKRGERPTKNAERINVYLSEHPNAGVREVARALSVSTSTASKWVSAFRGKQPPPAQPEREAV
jgi:hypothetical protein